MNIKIKIFNKKNKQYNLILYNKIQMNYKLINNKKILQFKLFKYTC